MTQAEKELCNQYLDDMDEFHSCNEYKLLKRLVEEAPADEEDEIYLPIQHNKMDVNLTVEVDDKVNCDKTKCYNCVNYGHCDYEVESEG